MGCGSSGLDWPVVTGWRTQTQQQVEARTHWNPFSDLCLPPDLQSGDTCIYLYGICICVCCICDPCLGCLITKVLWAGCQDLQTRPNVLCPLHRCYTLCTIYMLYHGLYTICTILYAQVVPWFIHMYIVQCNMWASCQDLQTILMDSANIDGCSQLVRKPVTKYIFATRLVSYQ